jgi:hypothetical protein
VITLVASAALTGSVLMAAPATAHASNYKGLEYSIVGGKAIVYDYTGSSSSVTVPAKLGGKPVVSVQINQAKVTKINVKKATSLTALSLMGTKVSSVDTSKNTKLVWLDVRSTKVSKLSLKKNSKLVSLYAAGDVIAKSSLNAKKLTRIEVYGKSSKFSITDYPNLKTFAAEKTNLTSVDLSKGKKLSVVTLYSNSKLAKLKVASSTLKTLHVVNNSKLTSVTVGKSPKLQTLYSYGKAVKVINLTGAADLRHLIVDHAVITSLKLSGAKKLVDLNVDSCSKLTKLDVTNLTKLNYVGLYDSAITELKMGNNAVKWLEFDGSKKLKKITLGKQPALIELSMPYVSGASVTVDQGLQPKLKTVRRYLAGDSQYRPSGEITMSDVYSGGLTTATITNDTF